jgi:hypothetical protein
MAPSEPRLAGDVRTSEPMVVDVRAAELWQDPYPVWHEARARHRIAQTTTGEPILLSADDLDIAGSDPAFVMLGLDALRRLGIEDGPFYEWRRLTLAAIDGEQHERLRSRRTRSPPRRVGRLRDDLRARRAAPIRPRSGAASTWSSTSPRCRCG